MNISLSVNANVANPFDNYDEKKFHEHFKTIKTVVNGLHDEIGLSRPYNYTSACKLTLFHS